jgi:glutamyl-tRNA reductase
MLLDQTQPLDLPQAEPILDPAMRGLPPRSGDALGVFGISYRSEQFHRLDGLRLSANRRLETLDAIQREIGFGELLYLCTCNRVEFIYRAERALSGPDDPRLLRLLAMLGLPADTAGAFHLHSGEQAIRYAFEVASALDSMVIGEAQVLGQFKRAFQQCQTEGRIGPTLTAVCETAFHVAKEVRNATGLATRKLSLVSLVSDELRCHLSAVPRPTIALLGAGEMIAKVAGLVAPCEDWRPGRLLFVNRTPERAEALARSHGGEALSLQSFLAEPPQIDLLVTATSAGAAVLSREQLAAMIPDSSAAGLLVIDLAVPGDVSRDVLGLEGLRLVGIEDLRHHAEQNRLARQEEIAHARPIVEQAVSRFRSLERERDLAGLAGRLRGALQEAVSPFAGPWPELVVARAHKVVMTKLRQQAPAAVSAELRSALSCPASLDKKAARLLSPAERDALDTWCSEQAARLSDLASSLLEPLQAGSACSA